MKAINVIIGFTMFSIVVSMMFAASGTILTKNDGKDAATFNSLSGQYDGYSSGFKKDGGVARDIDDASKQGSSGSDTPDVTLLSGALSGGRLVTNFYTNFDNIITNTTNEIGGDKRGYAYIDQRITNGILAIVFLFLVFVVIHFLRGFKTET